MHSDGPALKTIAGQRSRCKAAADAPKLRYANSHRLLIPWMVKALHSNQRGPPFPRPLRDGGDFDPRLEFAHAFSADVLVQEQQHLRSFVPFDFAQRKLGREFLGTNRVVSGHGFSHAASRITRQSATEGATTSCWFSKKRSAHGLS
jgi:hypothetical protein